jgi:AAA domain (dynein-related subfamily)
MTAYDFDSTFREFRDGAWGAPVTRARRQRWLDVRDEGHARWSRVLNLRARNLPYVSAVVDALLPYADTEENRALGRWRHPSSTLSLDLRAWFAREAWATADDWPLAAFATVQLIERCILCPERFGELCERYARSVGAKGIQSSLLSPVLNALVPARYHVVNSASLAALRAFTGVPWSPRFETYPKANAALDAFLREHRGAFEPLCAEGYLAGDVFDMFARWFLARAPEVLAEPWERVADDDTDDAMPCWKVSPGDRAQRWFKCLAEESMAFAWPELGDLTALPFEAFVARVKELSVERETYRGAGVEHLWELVRAPLGSLLVAARGGTLVLGVGRIAGPYRYAAGEAFPHQVPVDWFDPGERLVSESGWAPCIVPLDARWVDESLDLSDSGVHGEGIDALQPESTVLDLAVGDAVSLDGPTNLMVTAAPVVPVAAVAPPAVKMGVFSAPTLHLDHDADGELVVVAAPRRPSPSSSTPPRPRHPASVPPAPMPAPARKVTGPVPATERLREPSPETELASLSRLVDETSYGETELRRWVEAVRRKGQAIITGPTGTGKTFLAQHLARHLARGGPIEHLQLHAAYRYDDFVESQSGGARVPGRLLEFVDRTLAAGGPSVLVLDDLHRADLGRVLGEALHALEYRGQHVRLASGAELTIPRDLYVIGTMNANERAITVADQSLRRRFAFVALPARYDVLSRYLAARGFDADGLIETLREVNDALGLDAPLGTAHFFRDDLAEVIDDVWTHEVEPHLEHNLLSDERVAPFRWAEVRTRVLGASEAALSMLAPLAG